MIAVLTREAIQLPLGLTLTADSSELPLDRWTGPVRVGAGRVQVGDRSVRISRVLSVAAPTQLQPNGTVALSNVIPRAPQILRLIEQKHPRSACRHPGRGRPAPRALQTWQGGPGVCVVRGRWPRRR